MFLVIEIQIYFIVSSVDMQSMRTTVCGENESDQCMCVRVIWMNMTTFETFHYRFYLSPVFYIKSSKQSALK